MNIEVYADGSGTSADKSAGYGWVLLVDGKIARQGNGHMESGTNNDAEMEAAIHGLAAALRYKSVFEASNTELMSSWRAPTISVTLCSDSQITLGWADGTYKFKQESKLQKYQALKELFRRLNAKTRWVKGHSGDVWNERCDKLANLGRHGLGIDDCLPGKKKGKKQTLAHAKKEIEHLYDVMTRSIINSDFQLLKDALDERTARGY